jgi:hypothetical protein
MISIHLRSDIKPLCDRHPSRQMSLIFMQLEAGTDKPWQPSYVCAEPNCPRHYNPNLGYYNIFKQRLDPDTQRRVPCPNDALAMFVEKVDSEHQMWNWHCSQFGCNGSAVQAATLSHTGRATYSR